MTQRPHQRPPTHPPHPTPARRGHRTAPRAGRSGLRLVGATVLAAGLTVLGVPAADAHVRVHADSTASGSFSALTFRVPNESDSAGTVQVSVTLPQDTPFLHVSTRPVPGWQATTTEAALPSPVDADGTTISKAVRTVTWTAQGQTRIAPGEYQEFALSVGPLPRPGSVLLPTTQTYSDKTVVSWDQPEPASGAEPEHPAPQLTVTAAEAPGDQAPPGPRGADPPGAARDTTARVLSGLGLAVGAAGVVVGVLGRRRRAEP